MPNPSFCSVIREKLAQMGRIIQGELTDAPSDLMDAPFDLTDYFWVLVLEIGLEILGKEKEILEGGGYVFGVAGYEPRFSGQLKLTVL